MIACKHRHINTQSDHITAEVRADSGNILPNNKGIIPVIQMVNISTTAVGVTLCDVSADAALH